MRVTAGRLSRERVFVNMVYGDGFWGIGGVCHTDETLTAAIEAAV